eukprot:1160330-Pelagomonas_calceolata.AAC.9
MQACTKVSLGFWFGVMQITADRAEPLSAGTGSKAPTPHGEGTSIDMTQRIAPLRKRVTGSFCAS